MWRTAASGTGCPYSPPAPIDGEQTRGYKQMACYIEADISLKSGVGSHRPATPEVRPAYRQLTLWSGPQCLQESSIYFFTKAIVVHFRL